MKHKKNFQNRDTKKDLLHKKAEKIFLPKWLTILIISSILLNTVLLVTIFLPGRSLQKNMELIASRGSFAIIPKTIKVIVDEENKSYSIKFAELWENKLQRMNGYICEFPMKSFPSCSLIVDGELKIVSLGSMKDVTLAGQSQYLGDYFSKFYGINIRSLAGNVGIFNPDKKELTVYGEQFKDGLLKAMKLMYIQVNGISSFDELFPNGMNLASVGDYLRKFSAQDSSGTEVTIKDLQSKKNAIISVDVGCGSCKSKCGLMRDLLATGDVNVIFVLDSNEQDEDVKSFISQYVKGETVIYDSEAKLSSQLYMSEPPYLMLIGKDLKIHFKEKINDVTKDAEPAINEFLK